MFHTTCRRVKSLVGPLRSIIASGSRPPPSSTASLTSSGSCSENRDPKLRPGQPRKQDHTANSPHPSNLMADETETEVRNGVQLAVAEPIRVLLLDDQVDNLLLRS